MISLLIIHTEVENRKRDPRGGFEHGFMASQASVLTTGPLSEYVLLYQFINVTTMIL